MSDLLESPDIQNLSKQALQDLLNNLTQAKAFAIEQAPEFCQQLINRGMWLPFVSFIGMAMVCVLLLVATAVVYRAATKNDGDAVDKAFFCAFPVIGSIITAICASQCGMKALAVYIAPKVYLVEQITGMLK